MIKKDEKLDQKMTNPYYFTLNRFQNYLDSHIINHANFILTFIPIYTDFGIQTR